MKGGKSMLQFFTQCEKKRKSKTGNDDDWKVYSGME